MVLQFPADCLFDLMFALLTIDGVLVVARGWGVQKKKSISSSKGEEKSSGWCEI